jgi:hypothetical protein
VHQLDEHTFVGDEARRDARRHDRHLEPRPGKTDRHPRHRTQRASRNVDPVGARHQSRLDLLRQFQCGVHVAQRADVVRPARRHYDRPRAPMNLPRQPQTERYRFQPPRPAQLRPGARLHQQHVSHMVRQSLRKKNERNVEAEAARVIRCGQPVM